MACGFGACFGCVVRPAPATGACASTGRSCAAADLDGGLALSAAAAAPHGVDLGSTWRASSSSIRC